MCTVALYYSFSLMRDKEKFNSPETGTKKAAYAALWLYDY